MSFFQLQPKSEKYNSSAKFSCIPGYQFMFFMDRNIIRNDTNVSSDQYTTANSLDGRNIDSFGREIKLRHVRSLIFKCKGDDVWKTLYKKVYQLPNTLNILRSINCKGARTAYSIRLRSFRIL